MLLGRVKGRVQHLGAVFNYEAEVWSVYVFSWLWESKSKRQSMIKYFLTVVMDTEASFGNYVCVYMYVMVKREATVKQL